ncbi:MAG: hypothetical protein EOO80_01300 [Oxalobacteraceae bacterium]|nr:MAG: hypothetical protein EOO80_01300 [Oxalobacteraceae bacterium]
MFDAIALLGALILALALWGRLSFARTRESKRTGAFASQFVFIADDGTAHELSEEDKAYLNTEFHPADGARPYYKSKYLQLTPVGKMGGFLKRSRLPRNVPVEGPGEGP